MAASTLGSGFHPAEPDWKMGARDWLAVLTASAGAFLAVLDIQIANASLREISSSLGLSFAEGGWISTAYLIAEIVVIPLSASLSGALGLGRCFLFNGVGFVLSSVCCGFAWDSTSMIGLRIVQGLFGGMLIPLAFQTVIVFMPPKERVVGLSLFGLTVTLAPCVGPTFSGFVTDTLSWRFAFFANILPGAVMIYAAIKGFPKTRPDTAKLWRLDYFGALLLGITLGGGTYVLEEGPKVQWFAAAHIRYTVLAALVAFGAFVSWEWPRKERLLRFDLLKRRNFALSCFISLLSASALYGGIFAVSIYLGQLLSYRASEIGSVLMWVGVPQLAVMPFVPWLMKRVEPRILIGFGLFLFWWSTWLNVGVNTSLSGDEFRYSLILRALGQPLFLVPLSSIGMADILPTESGSASALFNVLRNIGGSIGIALTGTLLDIKRLVHTQMNLFQLDPNNTLVGSSLKSGTMAFRQTGLDGPTAELSAAALLQLEAARHGTIEAFSDVFYVLAIPVIVAFLLSLALNPPARLEAGGELH
jgi:MFS transporter, DHA2 family, multidrug resistance protein